MPTVFAQTSGYVFQRFTVLDVTAEDGSDSVALALDALMKQGWTFVTMTSSRASPAGTHLDNGQVSASPILLVDIYVRRAKDTKTMSPPVE